MSQNPFGHPSWCQCRSCEEWREDQLDFAALEKGVEALGRMKEMKRKYERWTCDHCNRSVPGDKDSCPGCGSPRKGDTSHGNSSVFRTATTLISGGNVSFQRRTDLCQHCFVKLPKGAEYCPNCGRKT